MAVAVVDVQVNSQGAVRNLQQVNAASKAATAGISTLRNAVAGLAAGFGAIQAAKFVFAKTAELESQARSIQTLTGSVQQAKQIIQELQQLGAATPFTGTELIESAKRLTAFGVSAKDVVETTRRLGDVAGATGANLGELSLAYGQVIAKGRLQGEELLQFQERGVALQDELRKMYGLTGEEFSKALSKGQISAEAVEVALQRLTDTGGKYANGAIAQSDTLNGRFSTLQDGVESLARTVGSALTPAIKAVLNEAIFALNTINQLIATGARAKSFGMGQAQRQQVLRQAQSEAERIVNMRRIKDPFERNRQFQQLAAQRERDLIESFGISTGQVKPQVTAPQGPRGVPELLSGDSGGRKGKSDAEKAADKAKREAERAAQQIASSSRSLGVAQQQFVIEQRLLTARKAGNEQLVLAREAQKDLLAISAQGTEILANKDLPAQAKANQLAELRYKAKERALLLDEGLFKLQQEQEKKDAELFKIGQDKLQQLLDEDELLRAKLAGNEAEVILRQQLRDITKEMTPEQKAQAEAIIKGNEALKQQLSVAEQMKSLYGDIGMSIKDGVVGAIQGAIDGTKSLQEVASNLLSNIANKLLDVAVNFALFGAMSGTGTGGGLLGGLFKKRAQGGSVMAGQPYLVGERGPELFMPGRSGGIARAGSFGGGANIVVNVDAGGTNVQGNQPEGQALGRAIAAAVQAELIKQKRPGGILA